MDKIEDKLLGIVRKYFENFGAKSYREESEESDVLMEAFGITQELKRENKQYWGRELGMCWQLLVTEIFRNFAKEFSEPKKYGDDEPVDFFYGKDAVDTKYRVGSGDSGTLKKFKSYGALIATDGYRPMLLLLRTDNLPAAKSAFESAKWTILEGDGSFEYIKNSTGFDLKKWLIELKQDGKYLINRR